MNSHNHGRCSVLIKKEINRNYCKAQRNQEPGSAELGGKLHRGDEGRGFRCGPGARAFGRQIEIRAADGTRARATREDKNHRTMDLKTLSSQVHTMRPLSGKTGKE